MSLNRTKPIWPYKEVHSPKGSFYMKSSSTVTPRRILCVCRWGNIRSVAFARLLKKAGHDALACRTKAASPETMEMLCRWADKILVASDDYISAVPNTYLGKVINTNIGEDVWLDADHPELLYKAYQFLTKAQLI